ncbi:hypothetical protein SODALDRAFT_318790 [Sodiomyces alkalinus F11]|uniref:Uncharacterized protein n=1 Tax=Sodiomyces alkalinus (strain CBS 110278 / VKM F-3762 / F11) TaxID=1314773 RepID=A0A3N2Q5H1_SODAK|nr:hypothetical protein SODALDRAFT_318790 [Sodiomyces alkalinus F11]ROT42020.1 hypothetical protein SODALDRAFT_318790 [Sodiomyces alkalinus F11]
MLSQKGKDAIDSVLPSFSVTLGHASIQTTDSIWESAVQCFEQILEAYEARAVLSGLENLRSILQATFDEEVRGLLDSDAQGLSLLDDSLDDATKARVLAQVVAGTVAVLERTTDSGRLVSVERFGAEVRRFAESDHRRRLVETIEGSKVFARCYAPQQIRDVMVRAVEDRHDGEDWLGEDGQSAIGWATELPSRNMGLPWGFTILALN